MSFKKEIEEYLEQISVWEELLRKVKELDTLPASFFSTSLDILDQLKSGLYEIESLQLGSTVSLTGNSDYSADSPAPVSMPVDEPAEWSEPVFLDDKISKKIYADLTKSLTVNQRFMFLRDVFKDSEEKMNETLTHLNALQTFEEAMDYLAANHPVAWETEAGIAFKELLKKRFA
jgi:hypothetical protein